MIDLEAIARVGAPDLTHPDAVRAGIAHSVAYLASDAALESIAVDPYWPKWDSPWWHMLLLLELGEARAIPGPAAAAMTAGIDRLLHTFPIGAAATAGLDSSRDLACHCALGAMAQVLGACGIDVAHALPWVRPWFARYQMRDGGFNCDDDAYLATDECPSSMVGTIGVLEALLAAPSLAPADRTTRDRAAGFLIERALVHGSASVQNAAERDAASAWTAPTFPRFYFYDVLRGLTALLRWSESTGELVPERAIDAAVRALLAHAPDGIVRVARNAYAAHTTLEPTADRSPSPRRRPASRFPLLVATSEIGAPSATLTAHWTAARAALLRLHASGRIVRA